MSYDISNYAQQLGSLIVLLLGILFFSKRDLPIRLIMLYGGLSFLFQVISNILIATKINPNFNANIYTITEALTLLFLFYTLFTSVVAKKITIAFAIIYIVSYFVLMTNHWDEFVSSTRTLRDLMIIICALTYFYFLMKEMPSMEITKYPMFWIMAGFLFFFSGTFALSLSINYLVKVLRDQMGSVWTMRNYFRFLFCFVICYGLWLDLKQIRAKSALNK